ncbi:hypothetical protein I4U23_017338 [Adineta vaga]|nr:hypothetical protein I4U23_017338 [Adineta vaga]
MIRQYPVEIPGDGITSDSVGCGSYRICRPGCPSESWSILTENDSNIAQTNLYVMSTIEGRSTYRYLIKNSDRKPIYIAEKWLICTRIQVLQVRLFILQGQKQTEKVNQVRAELSQSAASKKRDSTVA